MPLHLSPLSRRQFLTRTLAGGVAVLTTRHLPAAEPAEEQWVLLSDTHIDADAATVKRNVNMAEHLRTAVGEIGALAPTHVLVNGDLSLDHGLPGDYQQFTTLVQPLTQAGFTLHCTMGNHDAREVFWEQLQTQKPNATALQGKHLSIIETPLANWFLLDSLVKTLVTPGTLGEEQLKWLAAALQARPDKPALLMLHHDFLSRADGKTPGLTDTDALLALAREHRQVKALFCGHTHVWRKQELEGIHLVNLPAVAYPFSPTELTGWVSARLRKDGCRLEVKAFDKTHPKHNSGVELAWRA